jgi:DNA-binding NtrC family response regulator
VYESEDSDVAKKSGSSTVMVVDPDVLVRSVIAQYLRECGYRVLEGANADDVFSVLKAGEPVDIIFSEVKLSGELDGFGLAKRIRETRPEIDVLLTSGVAKAAEKASDLCDEGPLEKPYSPQEVLRRIQRLREHRRTTKKPLE